MRICIDSNQFIFGIAGTDAASETVLRLLPRMEVVLPRIVLDEVTRNLRDAEINSLYRPLNSTPDTTIVYEPVPADLVTKYTGLGLREKGDVFIGAFAEWQQVSHLISDNRHFLAELTGASFAVVNPQQFLHYYFPDK